MRRVELLGPTVQVVVGTQVVKVEAPRPGALLALLAAGNGRRPTGELLEELWPAPVGADKGALKVLVARLNRLTSVGGEDRLVVHERGDYRFDEGVEVDLVRLGVEALGALELGASPVQVLDLLLQWPGGSCPAEWADLPTVEASFRRLAALRLELLVRYVRGSLDAAPRPEVEHLVLAGLQVEPYDERLWTLLVELRYRHGRQAAALQAYDEARGRLVEDLGVEPGLDLRSVRDAVLRHDPSLRHPVAGTSGVDTPPGEGTPGSAPFEAVMASVAEALSGAQLAEASAMLDSVEERFALGLPSDDVRFLRVRLARAELAVLAGERTTAEAFLDDIVDRAIALDDLPTLVDAAIGPPALGSAGILGRSTHHERLQRAHDHVGGREAPRVGELRARLLRAARRAGDHPRHDHRAESLVEAARDSGVPTDLAHALYAAHKARYPYSDPEAEMGPLREVEVLAANRDTELWVLAVQAQAVVQLGAGRVDTGTDTNERAWHVATRANLPRRIWDCMTLRAALAACEGRLEESATLAEEAFAAAERFDISDAFGTFAMQQFVVMWHQDRIPELAAGLDALDGVDHGIPSLGAARGLIAAAEGRRREALDRLEECCSLLGTPQVDDHRLTLLCLAAQLATDAGADGTTARWLVERLEPCSGTIEVNLSMVLGPVDRLLGALLGSAGEPHRAMELLARTATASAAVGWTTYEVWSWADLARVALGVDDGRAREAAARALHRGRPAGLHRPVRLAEGIEACLRGGDGIPPEV